MMIFLKKAIIFDIESVNRCNAISRESMRIAIKEETNYDIDKKIIYLLEGMPGAKLVKEIFKREKIMRTIRRSSDNINYRIKVKLCIEYIINIYSCSLMIGSILFIIIES